MPDQLAFYKVPDNFKSQVSDYDLIDGSDLAMHVERMGSFIRDGDIDDLDLSNLLPDIRSITKIPLDYIIGNGSPVIQPAGPVVYCSLLTAKHREEMDRGFEKIKFILNNAEGEKEIELRARLLELEKNPKIKGKLWSHLDRLKRELSRVPRGTIMAVYTHW